MANQKISAMTTTDAQSGDIVPVLRSGANAAAYLGNMADDIENQRNVVGTIQMNAAVAHAQSVVDLGNEFSDVFTDETGINTGSSTNEIYNATSDYYAGGTASAAALAFNDSNYNSDATTPFTVTGTAQLTTYHPWKAFDGSLLTANVYIMDATSGYLEIDIGVSTNIFSYELSGSTSPAQSWNSWVLEGWNGSAWVNVDTQSGITGWSASELKSFNCDTPANYTKYKFTVSANDGDASYCTVREVYMYPSVDVEGPDNYTLISAKQDVVTDPTRGFIVVRHEAVDAVTMNTDFLAYISIDNGVTFTSAVTLTFFSVYDADSDIYVSGPVDVSAQSGSEVVIKYVTANSKEQRVHGHYFGVAP